ncbi:MAG: SEC-C domain-containing protein, partial [Planctomycetales bacterium]|nr:SEC-C domain-containing protein [Planctomycetales bacterium]
YDKISGMTGTAMTEANEFWKIYELEVIAIPTNRAMQRIEHPDVIYRSEEEKFRAIADEIERMHKWDVLVDAKGVETWGTILKDEDASIVFTPQGSKEKQTLSKSGYARIDRKGRPILVGTVSIEKSEHLSSLLERRGVKHEVLNAKHHRRESEIVAQAGRMGAVTIATNMAGRGTDIILGGNPETMAWAKLQDTYPTRLEVPKAEWDALVKEISDRENMKAEGELVKSLGGLHVIGSERHDARRIDLQLRGRCGRQGDPGSSRFFLSLRDDLMRLFAGPFVEKVLTSLGMQEGEAIESAMVSRQIEGAQKKVEERNFEVRKNLLEYDEVMDEQRKRVYRYRQHVLDGGNCKDLVLEMIQGEIDRHLDEYLDRDFGVESFANYAGAQLAGSFDAKQFRGLDFAAAEQYARDEAERMAESHVQDALDENLPEGEDESEWNWEALARSCNTRWGVSLRDRDLKKLERDEVDQVLVEKAREAIARIDLSDGAQYLDVDFGLRAALAWAHHKFGVEVKLDDVRELDRQAIKDMICEKAQAAYQQRESEYPVLTGLIRYSQAQAGGHTRIDREGLVEWAQRRFEAKLTDEDLKNKQRDEIRDLLIAHSRQHQQKASAVLDKVHQKVGSLFGDSAGDMTLGVASGGNGALDSLSQWAKQELQFDVPADELAPLDREQLEQQFAGAVEELYRPEMRRMERQLLLEIVDSGWKDHLLAMDYLRSAVGMRGYAQVDPKVEYKREGMRQFERMWESIGQRVTDLIFKMEQLNEDFIGSTWKEMKASHAEAQSVGEMAEQQQEAIDGMRQNAEKAEPIRNRGAKVGRNDPCPCGSGKKYKNCCLKNAS